MQIYSSNNISSMVLYIEDAYNTELNHFIQSNYQQIVAYFAAKDIDFCYLPFLLQSDEYQSVVSYNRPYLLKYAEDIQISEIYKKIKSKQTQPFNGAGLVWVNDNDAIIAHSQQLKTEKSLIDAFYGFADAVNIILEEIKQKTSNEIINIVYDNSLEYNSNLKKASQSGSTSMESEYLFKSKSEEYADDNFDFDAYRLADEIRIRIQLLKESNSLGLIGDILEEIQGITQKLSSVYITNDYRIFLKDYGMKEVEMAPLPKSLFLLFVRHPEGILFKRLSDYHDELLSIYRNVTLHENIDRAMESIRAMTDPLNNSINEKCSRIRAAFLEVITDDLAQNYYVTGKRAKPKKIILDRSLVVFQ